MKEPDGACLSRRDFARIWAIGGAAALLAPGALALPRPAQLPATPAIPDEAFWAKVRDQFLMPRELTILSAANLCPSPASVLEVLNQNTRALEQDPSLENRRILSKGREETRRLLARCLRASPEEIVITRNTSEGNNIVSSGVDLRAGDEVVVSSDNHPSAHAAFREKAKRFGFTVKIVDQVSPHPGPDYYLEAFTKAMTPRTRMLAFTHVTASVGDLMPASALCRMARERGVLTLVDGAQSFGVLDIDLSDMRPDFFTGSAHKWPCGPKELGVLYINRAAQSRIWPTIISLYAGEIGASKTFEALGQRDEAGIIAFGEALRFQNRIGPKVIEARDRKLAGRLIDGLRRIDGVKVWTDPAHDRSAAIVSFQPGSLDPPKLATALYEHDHIACNTRGGADRSGIRLAPHLYTLEHEVDRTLEAIRRYVSIGL